MFVVVFPGVGVKNEQLLVSKGIDTVEELRSLYQKLNTQSTDLKDYLQVIVLRSQSWYDSSWLVLWTKLSTFMLVTAVVLANYVDTSYARFSTCQAYI